MAKWDADSRHVSAGLWVTNEADYDAHAFRVARGDITAMTPFGLSAAAALWLKPAAGNKKSTGKSPSTESV